MTMDPVITKLQFKGQDPVLLLQAPPEFAPVARAWGKMAAIHRAIDQKATYGFAMVFVQSPGDVRKYAIPAIASLGDDAVFWMAYPKKTSKKYAASINRDEGWDALGGKGFEPVRAVAIDADWSGLRFRKVERIPAMSRRPGMALSEEGKKKTAGKPSTGIRKT